MYPCEHEACTRGGTMKHIELEVFLVSAVDSGLRKFHCTLSWLTPVRTVENQHMDDETKIKHT